MNLSKYKNIKPRRGMVVIKEIEDDNKALIQSGMQEGRAYAYIVNLGGDYEGDLKLGNLIVYNEYEGQELFKLGNKIVEDNIVIIREENILAVIE